MASMHSRRRGRGGGGGGGVSLAYLIAVVSPLPLFSENRPQKGESLTVGAVWYVVVCGETPGPNFLCQGGFLA